MNQVTHYLTLLPTSLYSNNRSMSDVVVSNLPMINFPPKIIHVGHREEQIVCSLVSITFDSPQLVKQLKQNI